MSQRLSFFFLSSSRRYFYRCVRIILCELFISQRIIRNYSNKLRRCIFQNAAIIPFTLLIRQMRPWWKIDSFSELLARHMDLVEWIIASIICCKLDTGAQFRLSFCISVSLIFSWNVHIYGVLHIYQDGKKNGNAHSKLIKNVANQKCGVHVCAFILSNELDFLWFIYDHSVC